MGVSDEPTGYRAIPSVAAVIDALAPLDHAIRPELAVALINESLQEARRRIAVGESLTREQILESVQGRLAAMRMHRLARVLNGTGIVIHTNLGRAPVSTETARAMAEAAASAVPLEIEPATNERGGRMREISELVHLLAGSEAVLVVNNNAAAVLLVLASLAGGREVIVSRGEAVEIGGGFRIPDVMRQSGAQLIEVGTTNRTYARDYERAIGPDTAAILKVHPSNFRMTGFIATPATEDLTALGGTHGIPVIEDLGSGALLDSARFGIAHEPTVSESLAAGVSIVTASGDKLLGGPQAGIIAGNRDLVTTIAAHPLARAVRADKTCLAGLAATLRHYLRGDAAERIPVWRMISAALDELQRRADRIIAGVPAPGLMLERVETRSSVGGGALPGQEMPSVGLRLSPMSDSVSADHLARLLRTHRPVALFCRVQHDAVVIDLRTILPEDDATLIDICIEVADRL